jgi:YfiH family protein
MATWVYEYASGVVLTHTTTRAEGDFAVDAEPDGLATRRHQVADHPWVWLRQVHGSEVVVATSANAAEVAGSDADAVVTADSDLVLAVQTADCVPVVAWSAAGVIGAAHAGWRGLDAGIIEATWAAMTELGADDIHFHVGPHIGVECYEFGDDLLERLAERFGERVRGTTLGGGSALDLREATRAAIEQVTGRRSPPRERPQPKPSPNCTACDSERWFSHRARAEGERMATAIWRESSYERAMQA